MILQSRRAGMAAWVAGITAFGLMTASAPAQIAGGWHCTNYAFCTAPVSSPRCELCGNGACGLKPPGEPCVAPASKYKVYSVGSCAPCPHPGHVCNEASVVCVRQSECEKILMPDGTVDCRWSAWWIYADTVGCIATLPVPGGWDQPIDRSQSKQRPEVSTW